MWCLRGDVARLDDRHQWPWLSSTQSTSTQTLECASLLVVEMLSRLPTEVIHEVTHGFQKRFRGVTELQRPAAFCGWCSSRSLMQDWKKCFVASLRLLYWVCVFQVVHYGLGGFTAEKQPIEWMSLHVGAERDVNYEHMHGLLTHLQKHWECQENRRKNLEPSKFSYKTIYMASWDVKTFDVAKPSVSQILFLIGIHTWWPL